MNQRERAFRTQTIILKRRPFNEADRLLTVFTPQHGKLDVIAKGARKPTSSKAGHVELFTRADMLIGRGRDFGIVTQAEMVAPYLALREDLHRGAYAHYAAELVDRFTTTGEEDQTGLFDLLDATLNRLCNIDDLRLVIRYYELHLLNLVGFRPELHECVLGHVPIQPQDQYFSFVEGGVISPQFALKNVSLVPLPLLTLKLMRHLQRSHFEQVRNLTVPDHLHADLERVMIGYITFLLESRLQSVDFIKLLQA